MTRPATLLAVLAVVLAAVASPLAAAAPQHVEGDDSTIVLRTAANESTDDAAPGATLNGALGSEGAELEGEVEQRSLDHALGTARSEEARAAVVAERLAAVEERLAELEAREKQLEEARENGTITDAEYRARMTVLAAQARSLDRVGSRTTAYATTLSPETLDARNVTTERIEELRSRAANVSSFDRDLFEGAYGDGHRPLDDYPLDETAEESWWNHTAPNESRWNGTDEFAWNATAGVDVDWDGTDRNESDWNESD